MTHYLFESERLGFRELNHSVLDETIRMNNDPDVMQYFPAVMTAKESTEYIDNAIEQQKNTVTQSMQYILKNQIISLVSSAYSKSTLGLIC